MSGTSIVGRVGESNVARVTSRGALVVEGIADTAGVPLRVSLVRSTNDIEALFATARDDLDNPATLAALSAEHRYIGSNLWMRERTPNVFKPLSAVVITAETTIWTPAAGKKFRIMGYAITQGVVTGAITLKDNTAGTTILVIPPNTIGVVQISPAIGNGILSAAANNVLTATGVATETITGYIFGTEE